MAKPKTMQGTDSSGNGGGAANGDAAPTVRWNKDLAAQAERILRRCRVTGRATIPRRCPAAGCARRR